MTILDNISASLRPHFTTIANLALRDLPLQLASGMIVCAIMVRSGHLTAALFIGAAILIGEFLVVRSFKRRTPFQNATKDKILLANLALASSNNVFYTVPALFMAADPSLAIKVTAVLWLTGIQVYTVNMWARLPPFLYGMLVPTMIVLVLTVFELTATEPEPSSLMDWGIAFLFVVIFIYATVDSLFQQVKTERELVVAQRKAAERLSQLSENQRLDPLTNLLNRPAFDTALSVMLTDRLIVGGEIAVFLVDLDNFKPINDTYSHEAGDCLLQTTADRLTQCVGADGIVGRLGGDEFICAIQDLPHPAAAMDLAYRLAQAINQPIAWNNHSLKISASIGISISGMDLGRHGDKDSVKGLCTAADQAMFAAKTSANTNPVLFEAERFSPNMSSSDKQALIEAIAQNKIRPHYQPKMNLVSEKIVGLEALARWHHPDGSLRQPDTFLTQIHTLGLQGDFMACMARQVVEDVHVMLEAGLNPGQVSFNVPEVALATHSGSQDLKRIVTKYEETTKHLTFEITEDVFIARAADAIQASIAQFRDMGVRISLDDFGTGFASFHHLSQLDFDEMKIDTSFVAGLGNDATADVLVEGFLNIASGLGVSVIAEGVETHDQSDTLLQMGCLVAQGFLYSSALPINEIKALLAQDQSS